MSQPSMPQEKPNVWLSKPENDPIEFLLGVAQSMHVGDTPLLLMHLLSGHSIGLADNLQVSIYTVGESGKGKSHAAQTIFNLFPKKYAKKVNTSSEKWLFYIGREKK